MEGSTKLHVNDTAAETAAVDFSQELAEHAIRARRTKWARFVVAALTGIPWVGSLIGAIAVLKSEQGQQQVDDLQRSWLDAHAGKFKELEADLQAIMQVAAHEATPEQPRLEQESYLELVRQGFRIWDEATSDEKRHRVRRTLSNAAVSKIVSDDLVRLFLNWIERYDDVHFKIVGLLHRTSGLTRADLWRAIDGREVREDSADADLFKMIIRDLSTGNVIRQHRAVTATGDFLRKPSKGSRGTPSPVMKSAFDDRERYELTELGHIFVGFALDEPAAALQA